MSTPLSRRAWLRTTSLGVGAGLLLPDRLAALPTGHAVAPSLLEHARGVERARARAGAVRLSSNENPYGMSPKAKQAFMDTWGEHNRYGSPQIASLKAAFAKHIGLPADHVMVTQGSQEVLCTAALAFGGKDRLQVFHWSGVRLQPAQTDENAGAQGSPARLREQQGFLVSRAFPPYNDWMRVSVGTPDEMRAFATKLPGALGV